MITVHVWHSAWKRYKKGLTEGSPGHASIEISDLYVSFWPGETVKMLKWRGHSMKTLKEDINCYKKQGQKHYVIPLQYSKDGEGLDESLMQARFRKMIKTDTDYTVRFQCAAVVNELLIAGGSQKFLPMSFLKTETWVIEAVSPGDIRDYATSLAEAIANYNGAK